MSETNLSDSERILDLDGYLGFHFGIGNEQEIALTFCRGAPRVGLIGPGVNKPWDVWAAVDGVNFHVETFRKFISEAFRPENVTS
jgi:hypothetical protein